MTPSEIEPATFWLVAQCLNQLRPAQKHSIKKHFYGLVILNRPTVSFSWEIRVVSNLAV